MQQTLIDTLLERPIYFVLSGEQQPLVRRFALCQPPLGVVLLTAPLLAELSPEGHLSSGEPLALEALRLSHQRRPELLRLVAIYTLSGQAQWLSQSCITARMAELEPLTAPELASLLLTICSMDSVAEIMEHFGIDKETARRQRIASLKSTQASGIGLGGRTIYGSLIDEVAQRYGYTLQYILWEISYANLKLLLADATTYHPLSASEMASLGIASEHVIAMDEVGREDEIAALLSQ